MVLTEDAPECAGDACPFQGGLYLAGQLLICRDLKIGARIGVVLQRLPFCKCLRTRDRELNSFLEERLEEALLRLIFLCLRVRSRFFSCFLVRLH